MNPNPLYSAVNPKQPYALRLIQYSYNPYQVYPIYVQPQLQPQPQPQQLQTFQPHLPSPQHRHLPVQHQHQHQPQPQRPLHAQPQTHHQHHRHLLMQHVYPYHQSVTPPMMQHGFQYPAHHQHHHSETIYNHYHHRPLDSPKKHKKSKSLPANKVFESSSYGNSGSGKKSHNAEAPLSQDIKFPIARLKPGSLDPYVSNMLNNVYTTIEVKKYSTSAIDPARNYLTVYEYAVNKHWVIWDYETGFVHLTGIWKASLNEQMNEDLALGHYLPKSHAKADIVKLLETTPKQYQQHIKRIRGGFLKIQGTWLPYYLCKIVARKFCYYIRYELIPIFGEDFPDTCLLPDDPGFGKLRLDEPTMQERKKARMNSISSMGSIASAGSITDSIGSISTAVTSRSSQELTSPLMNVAWTFSTPQQPHNMPPTSKVASTAVPPIAASSSSSGSSGSLSASSSTSSSSSSSSSYSYMFGDTSYNDMMDIMTASKCLQSLRNSTTTRPSVKSDHGSDDSVLPAAKRRFSLKIHDLIS